VVVLAAVWFAGCATPPPEPLVVRLIAFNDFHGNLEAAPGLTLSCPGPTRHNASVRSE
jgi:hypothetical protein